MVDVTLWEKYSIALMNFLADRKNVVPVVLILTHAQCKLGGQCDIHLLLLSIALSCTIYLP